MNELGMGSRPQYFVQRNPLCERKVERTRQKIDLESRSHETAKVSSEIRDQVVPLLSVY